MKRLYLVFVFTALAALALGITAFAQEANVMNHVVSTVQTHPSQGEVTQVEDAQAELFSTENGITMNFRTSDLEAGHIYTAWWVIVNNPEGCTVSPCPASEVLGNPDALQSEVTYADGLYVNEEGRLEFAGSLPAGEVPESWYGNGLSNPLGAEVHIVIHDHGAAIPEIAGDMLNTLRAGCTDESVPAPYPDYVKTDGVAGPNTCKLIQFAVFQQAQ